MRFYSKNNLFICYIDNYLDYSDRKINLKKNFVFDNKYYTVFLKVSSNSYFDLSTGEYYKDGDKPMVNEVCKMEFNSNDEEISYSIIQKEAVKIYSLIRDSHAL